MEINQGVTYFDQKLCGKAQAQLSHCPLSTLVHLDILGKVTPTIRASVNLSPISHGVPVGLIIYFQQMLRTFIHEQTKSQIEWYYGSSVLNAFRTEGAMLMANFASDMFKSEHRHCCDKMPSSTNDIYSQICRRRDRLTGCVDNFCHSH